MMTVCLFAIVTTAKAQCDLKIANLVYTKTAGPNFNGTDCEYTFDASFDIITNSGFKYLFFHSWTSTNYVASFTCQANGNTPAVDPPTSATLGTAVNTPGKSFLDLGFIGLNNLTITSTPMNVTSSIATTYPNDPSVVLTKPTNSFGLNAMVYRKGTSDTLHFDITNISVVVAGACGPFSIKADIWGSNSNGGTPKAQCYICGLGQTINNPSISLVKTCTVSPFTYTLGLTTSAGTDLHVTYKLYADMNFDNNKQPGGADPLIYTSGVITLPAGQLTTIGPLPLPNPYCCIDNWAQAGIYVEVAVQEFSNSVGSPIVNGVCATLPIKLKSFNAKRTNRSNVDLTWETEMESDSKGFYVERLVGSGAWTDIAFVPSKAVNGTSTTPLSYNLSDLNDAKGITQYRLRQVDLDGKKAYSLIRSVRGEGQKSSVIIYPNPSGDGKVNVIFDDVKGIRDVSVTDMSGRMVKQMKGVTNNNIQIDNLNAGFYTVRILNTETGEQAVEKFVVNKR